MTLFPNLAIVGAGIAGLACATKLQEAGLKVRLFEKSGGVSGRMSTRRGNDWQCDHGAQYFTARHPDFRAEVARWQRAAVAGLWNPKLQVFGGESLHAPDLALERFVGTPTMTAPARLLSDALPLTFHATIQQLQRQPDGWQLLSAEDGWLVERFDAVVLAIPAPQAAPLLQPLSTELAELARSAGMGGCWTVMARFATPPELPFDAAFVNEGPLRWIARDTSKPDRSGLDTWVLHASVDWSEAHLEQDADTVAAALLKAFERLGAPAPQAWTVHRWRYANAIEPALDRSCAWHADAGLGLCGDWLNGGKVEGAWLSGRQLALRILESSR
jgi:predicted NAD/FAD-dependent oxidoreductase